MEEQCVTDRPNMGWGGSGELQQARATPNRQLCLRYFSLSSHQLSGGREKDRLERDRLWPRGRVGVGAWHSCGVEAALTPPLRSASVLQILWSGEQMSCWRDSLLRAPLGPLLPEASAGQVRRLRDDLPAVGSPGCLPWPCFVCASGRCHAGVLPPAASVRG